MIIGKLFAALLDFWTIKSHLHIEEYKQLIGSGENNTSD
jgi:hypothetical protein